MSFAPEAFEPLNRVRVAAGWSWDRLAREVSGFSRVKSASEALPSRWGGAGIRESLRAGVRTEQGTWHEVLPLADGP